MIVAEQEFATNVEQTFMLLGEAGPDEATISIDGRVLVHWEPDDLDRFNLAASTWRFVGRLTAGHHLLRVTSPKPTTVHVFRLNAEHRQDDPDHWFDVTADA